MAKTTHGWKLALVVSRKNFLRRGNIISCCVFVAFLLFIAIQDSLAAAIEMFPSVAPYLLLFFAQDLFKSEIERGSLENVLFVNGNYRRHIWRKSLLTGLMGSAIIVFLFFVLAILGMLFASGSSISPTTMLCSLIVGLYFYFLAVLLGHLLKGGSNVLVVVLLQLLLFLIVAFSLPNLLDSLSFLGSGSIPDKSTALLFSLILMFFPNFIMQGRFAAFAPIVVLYILLLLFIHFRKINRLEITRS